MIKVDITKKKHTNGYLDRKYKYNLEQPVENINNRGEQLLGIFLYPFKLVGKHFCLLLLFPWLTAVVRLCSPRSSTIPSAPAHHPASPYSPAFIPASSFSANAQEANAQQKVPSDLDPPPLYSYDPPSSPSGPHSPDQYYDVHHEIKPQVIQEEKPVTKKEAKKSAKNALESAQKDLATCREYVHNILPPLQDQHLFLSQTLLGLKKYFTTIKNLFNGFCIKRDITSYNQTLNKCNAKLHRDKATVNILIEAIQTKLSYAASYIQQARDLGSVKVEKDLEQKKRALDSDLQALIKVYQEMIKNQTVKQQLRQKAMESFGDYFDYQINHEHFVPPSLPNNSNANVIINSTK